MAAGRDNRAPSTRDRGHPPLPEHAPIKAATADRFTPPASWAAAERLETSEAGASRWGGRVPCAYCPKRPGQSPEYAARYAWEHAPVRPRWLGSAPN